jgi:hypothetical protein
MSVTWNEQPITFSLSAEDLSQEAAQSIADACRQRIPQGQLSDGSGPQAPPRQPKIKVTKRGKHVMTVMPGLDGVRGYDNGNLLAKRIKAIKQAGGVKKAAYMVTLKLNAGKIADRVYAWLEREAAEGVEYIHTPAPGSPGDKEMNAAIAKVLDEAIK